MFYLEHVPHSRFPVTLCLQNETKHRVQSVRGSLFTSLTYKHSHQAETVWTLHKENMSSVFSLIQEYSCLLNHVTGSVIDAHQKV